VQQEDSAASKISHDLRQAACGTEDLVTHLPRLIQAAGETNQLAARVLEVARDLFDQAERVRQLL
jgi:hypothetical protein